MGSYLSIENNTEDSYLVKVGPDEEALRITSIVGTVVAVIGAVVSGAGLVAGAVAPLAVSLAANGVVEVLGVSTATLSSISAAAASVGAATGIATKAAGWSQSFSVFVTSHLIKDEGFVEIKPGETRSFGKYTLSLWRQATCIRVRQNPDNEEEVVIDAVYMRPIFTGPTDGSTQPHNIKYWVDWKGHRDRTVVRLGGAHSKL